MPELNSIDDFFRRKEQESSPNNDNMAAHWTQMNELMKTPSTTPVKGTKFIALRKYILYAAAVVLIVAGTLFLFFAENNISKPNNQSASKSNTEKTGKANSSVNDSLPGNIASSPQKTSESTIVKNEMRQVKTKTEKNYTNKKETITTEIITTTVTKPKEEKIDNAKAFSAFFTELEKPAEEFVVNTTKDTIVVSKEGTRLTIPANAFLNANGQLIRGAVKIYLQEFYNVSDIIGNKLTTMSNEQPLITGGMFNIIAETAEEQVKINPQQPLRLDIPTKRFDPFMQLFKGQQQSPVAITEAVKKESSVADTFIASTGNGINWVAAGQPQYSMINTSNKQITILNLRDNPYDVFYGKKIVGRFEIPYDCKLSKEEAKAELEKRYSKWYDVIKVRREPRPWGKKNRVPSKYDWYATNKVGDSIVVSLRMATRLRMITIDDSLAYEAEFKRQYDLAVKQENSRSEWLEKKDKYSFTITDLGWINCDRFLNYPGRKLTDFVLNPGNEFSETYLYSVLIFTNLNSIMPGQWVDGKIIFQRIPLNEYVHMVSIGVKNGKAWACIQPYYVQKEEVNKMFFEETSPEQLKGKLERFGNVMRVN